MASPVDGSKTLAGKLKAAKSAEIKPGSSKEGADVGVTPASIKSVSSVDTEVTVVPELFCSYNGTKLSKVSGKFTNVYDPKSPEECYIRINEVQGYEKWNATATQYESVSKEFDKYLDTVIDIEEGDKNWYFCVILRTLPKS